MIQYEVSRTAKPRGIRNRLLLKTSYWKVLEQFFHATNRPRAARHRGAAQALRLEPIESNPPQTAVHTLPPQSRPSDAHREAVSGAAAAAHRATMDKIH